MVPKDAVKEDKIAYQTKEMFMDALQPLVACLEQAGKGNFMIKEAIPMIQSAIILIGNAVQYQSFLKRRSY